MKLALGNVEHAVRNHTHPGNLQGETWNKLSEITRMQETCNHLIERQSILQLDLRGSVSAISSLLYNFLHSKLAAIHGGFP